MSDSFFGFDTALSNINDDDGGGGDGAEDEYDALNDETFGHERDDQDWEIEHELVAEQLESSRRNNSAHNHSMDESQSQLEASLSQLVLDESDAPSAFGSHVWRHDPPPIAMPPSLPAMKNVHTVEELERQMRQKQQSNNTPAPLGGYYQPRFPPVILQRPPGLQAPVPLPFAQQPMGQQLNNMMSANNQMGPHTNQMGQIGNQIGPMSNQMGQIGNQMMGNNQLTQNVNQFMQNSNQFQNSQQQQNMQVNQSANQMNQLGNQMNQLGNQMLPNGNQFGSNMNQFPHNMMNQPRMMAPPPGMNMPPMQNFNPNVGFNQNFRGPTKQPMEQPPINQQNMMMNQQLMQQQIKNQSPQINQINQPNPQLNQINPQLNQINPQLNQINPQLNQINPQLNQVNPQLNQVNPQFNQVNQQKNQMNQSSPQQHKMQKQRVIYNSNQKNMTSENLVQFIQNNHPILQLQQQQNYHNAQHHPMLNNRPGLPYNNQVVNHPMFNQRQNGNFNNNNRHLMNGDDGLTNGTTSCDPYAGLMTSREKQWLINIQMLQLNTGTPYIHDFYYTVFLARQSMKEKEGIKEAHKANQQNHPFYSGGVKQETHRERHNSARHNSVSEDGPRTYIPTQFENSLGKLQCGSVTAPRKIIDVEMVQGESGSARASRAPSAASTTNPAEAPREMRRTKQLLLDIEALYLILLRLEELNDPLAISNALILKEREEKQRQLELAAKESELEGGDDTNLFLRNIESVQRRPKTDSPKHDILDKRQVVNLTPLAQNPSLTAKNLLDENKDDLMNRMYAGLLHEDRLQQFLLVRKGKKLVSRFLSRACGSGARLRGVWLRVLRALPLAARRDDGALATLAAHYAQYIQSSTGWAPVLESCSILSEAFDPARTPYALTSSLTLSCVCALIERASTLVNTPEATSNERLWTKFLKTFARALKNTTLIVAKPVHPISETKLLIHIKQIESRNTIEILQRGKTAAEFADLSKSDFSQLLIAHLC